MEMSEVQSKGESPSEPARDTYRAVSRWTRVGISLQVLLVIVLSVAVAVVAIDLSAWAPLRLRADLTLRGRNTLDPALNGLIERLPEQATIETFLQPLPGALEPLWVEARTRSMDVLQLAARVHPGKLELVQREADGLEAMRARMGELGLRDQGGNIVVVRLGERHEILHLFGDLTILNQNSGQIPTVSEHRAGLALGEALSSVSMAGAPRVLFSSGHGEPAIDGGGSLELEQLRRALQADGFEVGQIDLDAESEIPSGCEVLAVFAPTDPFSAEAIERVNAWVDNGGRLLVAVGNAWSAERAGDASQWIARLGMELQPGIVCEPVVDSLGGLVDGLPQVSYLRILQQGLYAQHPITQPLHEAGRGVLVHNSRAFRRGTPPAGGVLLDLMRTTSPYAWADLPRGNNHDWSHDPVREPSGPFSLGMSVEYEPKTARAISELSEGDEIRQARAVGLAGAHIFANENFETNRDFAVNVFNWLAERDFRLTVSILDPDRGRIDVRRGSALSWVNRIGVWGLPAVCALLGFLITWLRRH